MVGRVVLALALALVPLSAAEPIRVLVFTTTDCPISNRYAPEIQRLAARFGATVKFVLVYPVAADSPEVIRQHQKKFGYALESIRDTSQRLVKQTGVTVTPEVAVLAGERLLYRGRIDDRYVELGRERAKPTTHDLETALDQAIAGTPIAVRETQAVGCFLPDLVK
jgi:hypothetical protein